MGKKQQRYSDHCIIVVDIESTCQENIDGVPQEEFVSEIIEIGYAILNTQDNQIIETGSIVVKPEVSKITPFCTNLTGWTQEAVDRGISFKEACETLSGSLRAGSRPWASFGNYDAAMFKKQCERTGVKYPFTPQHLNVKPMAFTFTSEMAGTGRTLSLLGLQFEGRQHSGKDDAYNVARILQFLALKHKETKCKDYLK